MRCSRTGGDRSGHVDNSIVVWIVLILVAVMVPKLYQLRTGRPFTELLASVPGAWRTFLLQTLVLTAAGAVAVVAASVFSRRNPVRVVESGSDVVVHLRSTEVRTVGVLLAVLAAHAAAFAWTGGGPVRWLVAGVAVPVGLLGLSMAVFVERVLVQPGRVALERGIPGGLAVEVEHGWAPGSAPEVRVETFTTGGAFGQPVQVHTRCFVGDTALHEGRSPRRAEGLCAALSDAVRRVGGGAPPSPP